LGVEKHRESAAMYTAKGIIQSSVMSCSKRDHLLLLNNGMIIQLCSCVLR